MAGPHRSFFWLCIVLLLTLASYLNSINAAFHFDDYHTAVQNLAIRNPANIPKFFSSLSSDSGFHIGSYRPVVTTTLALNYLVSRLEPWSYHAFNIGLHLLNVILVYLIALFLLKKVGKNGLMAALAAGIFGLHPVQTNAVSYIIARSALLCTLFYLLSFYAYIRLRDGGEKRWFVISFLSFGLALLTKELAITLPIMLIFYEIFIIKERVYNKYKAAAVFLTMDAVYLAVKFYLIWHFGRGDAISEAGSQALVKPYVTFSYLRLFAFPFNLNFYPDPPVPDSLADPIFWAPMAIIMAIISLIIILLKKYPVTGFLLAWFFLALIPETFLYLNEPMIEYRLYLPSAGLSVLAAITAAYIPSRKYGRAMAAPAIIIAGLFIMLAINRNSYYIDDTTLWRDAVSKSPRSAMARSYLGEACFRAGKYDEAAKNFSQAVTMDPVLYSGPIAYNYLGQTLEKINKDEMAIEAYKKGLEFYPNNITLLINFWALCARLERPGLALGVLERAAEIDPGNGYIKGVLEEARKNAG